MSFNLHPIGLIRSPFTDPAQVPIQAALSQARGQIELYPEYAAALADLDGFSHLHLLYVFHRSAGFELRVTPFLDTQPRGLFATRYPKRPNPLGLSVVRLLAVRGCLLDVEGLDVLDHTPLLDIKPYVPQFDERAGVRTGWYPACPAEASCR
jgi:tRNA-Thr(GGU) m(6)t(6)A37 methyltransferase TsaA